MYELSIILRTCDRVQAFSGSKLRDFGLKKEVMRRCFNSLITSINHFEKVSGHKANVIIVDDHSSVETVNFMKSNFPNSVIEMRETGNGESFKRCVDLACNLDGLVLLLEDDYLLDTKCLTSMVESYHILKSIVRTEVCIHPTDYPDRYKHLEPSYILLGSDRHYRTINKTTCTFMYDSSVFQECKSFLERFYEYGKNPNVNEDTSINLVYQKYPCFSPIPSLAEHLQYKETLSPFYEYK